jgi:hypothetical protein
MRSNSYFFFNTIMLIITLNACGSDERTGSKSNVNVPTNGKTLPVITGNNVIPLTINGSTCSAATSKNYFNKPCVSVTICTPGTDSNCQTINDILLDTGSYGLRVFKSSITASGLLASLTQVTAAGGGELAECTQYGDGSSDWGPVVMANVVLGNEPGVTVPIQLLDPNYFAAEIPSTCPGPSPTPVEEGYTGILGVGLFAEDCGSICTTESNTGVYFECTGGTCAGTTATIAQQVKNPVAFLPEDNNGVIVELPSIALGGALSISGYLVLGIGTGSNNKPSGVTAYPADQSANFKTTFNGATYNNSFIDSGSNALYFKGTSSLPACASASGFFCPASTVNLSAITAGASGSPQIEVAFQIGNLLTLFNSSSNNVFMEAGGDGDLGGFVVFDWGLPFFIGRNVYIGLDQANSSLGKGPYWAY